MTRGAVGLAAGLVAVAVAVAPSSADSSPRKKSRLDTFAGSCEFAVVVRFTPPLAPEPQSTHAEAAGSGPCTGTWRTRKRTWQLDGDKVRYKARSDGTQSCASANPTGDGLFKFRGRTLRFSFAENRVGATAELALEGTKGGLFSGTAQGEGDPVEIAQQCLTEGLGEARATITGETEPTISG